MSSWKKVSQYKALTGVGHKGKLKGMEQVKWELTLECGHTKIHESQYVDADGPEDAGPHLPPKRVRCHQCVARPGKHMQTLEIWEKWTPYLMIAVAAVILAVLATRAVCG